MDRIELITTVLTGIFDKNNHDFYDVDMFCDDVRKVQWKRIFNVDPEFLVDFNAELTGLILKLAGIDKDLKLTGSYGKKDQNIQDLRAMVEPGKMEPAEPRPYWQVFKQKYGFIGNLSAVDLLFNMGPEFPLYL